MDAMDDQIDNSDGRELWLRAALPAGQTGGCADEGLLAAYLDGRAEDAEVEAVERHLAGCARCRAAVRQLRGILSGTTTVMPPTAVLDRARQLVEPNPGRRRLWPAVARWSAVAAAVLIVAWVGFSAGRKTGDYRRAADAVVAVEASFGGQGEDTQASLDTLDEMLLAGGPSK